MFGVALRNFLLLKQYVSVRTATPLKVLHIYAGAVNTIQYNTLLQLSNVREPKL
jgi:hypothetical protein